MTWGIWGSHPECDEAYRKIISALEEVGFVDDEVKDQVESIITAVVESNHNH
jgi:hypothetical protein